MSRSQKHPSAQSLRRWLPMGIVVLLLLFFTTQFLPAMEPASLPTASAMARAVKKVPPDYPIAAKQLHVNGQQEVEIIVDGQGNVESAKVVKGNPLFTTSSVNAAKQWKFTPLQKDGQATPFTTVLLFNYQM